MDFTPAQENEIRALQGTFPFRLIYAAQRPDGSEWFASAVTSMRIPKKLARDGWAVVIVHSVPAQAR